MALGMGSIFPSGGKIIGVVIIALVAVALVNNVTFLSDLTKRRVA